MNKEELAAQFAEQKVEELTKAIKEAYLKGYEQGSLDNSGTVSINNVSYVDLGLPSGTLWSEYPLFHLDYGYKQKRLSYVEAARLPIPTKEQWDEVCQLCRFEKEKIIGPSGKRIGYKWAPGGYLIHDLGEGCKKGEQMYWLKGEVDSNNEAPTMIYDLEITGQFNFIKNHIKGSSRHFTGYKLPVFLVKNKE